MSERKTWSTQQDKFIHQKVQSNKILHDKDKLKWADIAEQLNKKFPQSHRSGKQCRQRWHNQLDPAILHSQWTVQQERKLFDLQKKVGNRWAEIAQNIKGRTDNNVKNYFYSTLRKSLRKLNAFISLNRNDLRTAKEFKQSSLSKLLAVADHKFDKKINIKNDTAQSQAIQIKNMLIEITRLQINDQKSRGLFFGLVKRLQEWNKCCKKKKGKKKQQIQIGQQDHQEESIQDEQIDQDNDEEQIKVENIKNLEISRNSRANHSRSRDNKAPILKKQSNISKNSKNSKKQKINKKQPKQEKKSKQSVQNNNKILEIPQIIKKQSSRQQSNLSGSNFYEVSRSSLDLGNYKKRSSNSPIDQSCQLFKSFVINDHSEQNSENQQMSQEKRQSRFRVTRSGSNLGFLNMIKQVSLRRQQSQQSGIEGFLQQDEFNPFGIGLLKRQSSKRQLPQLRHDESFLGFSGLDQSLRFQPQISKLRSWKKDSSNFQMEYKFENANLN